MLNQRASGILLHPTSLPGPHGIGDIGPEAYRFVDLLEKTGQSLWQVLPLGPTGYGNSPYMSFSAFGGNPLLISPDLLREEGMLAAEDLKDRPRFSEGRVEYESVIHYKYDLLEKAYRQFRQESSGRLPADFYSFCERNAFWVEDYALFMSLKEAHEQRVWSEWEESAARHVTASLARWRNELADRIQFRKFLQYIFFKQWCALKDYCHERNIRIIGDIPIYVAYDSAEVWANSHLFHLDEQGDPIVVAGVPPDYFSSTGQRWGNPIYRWEAMAERGFQWWIERFRMNFALADVVRLDHFRGFEAYWEVPASEETATNGRWARGPGAQLFYAVAEALERLGIEFDVIAEDLGVITPDVDELRDKMGFPGMRILQMAFGNDPKAADYKPHNYDKKCAAYTATHDHNTTAGWFTAEPGSQTTQTPQEIEAERRLAMEYVGSDGHEIHWDFIRLVLASVANTAIVPMQDLLGLGTESRMNRPGSASGNWEWRLHAGAVTSEVSDRLRELTNLYGRKQNSPDDPSPEK
ncbi:MAG: 4-alpha-glucanotransferase [Phycisphaerae bacterium]|nr:4-alpha-glucanotransferase [Phycisphaerae bacterium]